MCAACQEEDEESDEEGPIYNPLNLPLGWDGKPIPYWLYKLHGLGVEFKCEICGDFSYKGRRCVVRWRGRITFLWSSFLIHVIWKVTAMDGRAV